MSAHDYQAFYCEENIWRLLHEPRFHDCERSALFIGNDARQVALWHQRIAPRGDPVLWDYHVVALIDDRGAREIWDLDTRLPLPCALADWLANTFVPLAPELAHYAPRFRLVDFAELEKTFATDRRHMRTSAGAWQKPPPAWPAPAAPGESHTLDRYLDFADPIAGRVLTLAELTA